MNRRDALFVMLGVAAVQTVAKADPEPFARLNHETKDLELHGSHIDKTYHVPKGYTITAFGPAPCEIERCTFILESSHSFTDAIRAATAVVQRQAIQRRDQAAVVEQLNRDLIDVRNEIERQKPRRLGME